MLFWGTNYRFCVQHAPVMGRARPNLRHLHGSDVSWLSFFPFLFGLRHFEFFARQKNELDFSWIFQYLLHRLGWSPLISLDHRPCLDDASRRVFGRPFWKETPETTESRAIMVRAQRPTLFAPYFPPHLRVSTNCFMHSTDGQKVHRPRKKSSMRVCISWEQLSWWSFSCFSSSLRLFQDGISFYNWLAYAP